MRTVLLIAAVAGLALPAGLSAQRGGGTPNARHPGSAVITVGENEYTIRIECRVPGQPEDGFTTEPNRITREETGGHYNMVALRLRPWQDTGDVVVSLEHWVQWMPTPSSSGGVLSLDIEMVPSGFQRNGMPELLTYDMWKAGDVPGERTRIRFHANCNTRDPEAPKHRKLPGD